VAQVANLRYWAESPKSRREYTANCVSPNHKTKRYRLKLALACALIKGKVSSWLLATDFPLSTHQVAEIYRRRFWCEESFRDQKQEFRLESVRVQRARRLENLLLALAIVYLILAVMGIKAKSSATRSNFRLEKRARRRSPGFR